MYDIVLTEHFKKQLKRLMKGEQRSMSISSLYHHHRSFWNREQVFSVLSGLLFLSLALVVKHFSDHYVSNLGGTRVDDLLLNWLPTLDIDFLMIQSAFLLTLVTGWLFVSKPQYLPFGTKALAIFLIFRSFFVTLTHLGLNPHQFQIDDTGGIGFWVYDLLYNSRNDFFFSGHTGIPFLMGLIFWREKIWRNFFFIISFLFGLSVLIAHVHYSIDVFAAPFMTYSIFRLSRALFPKDAQLALP